jgi:5'-methylthioadenosine phosphorylase
MQVDIGIIGGTGIGDRLLRLGGTALHVPTPAGVLRGRYVQINGLNLFLIGRHSAGHKVPPHKVNYRSMALGMRKLGVKACLATAAVGSLRVDWPAGTMVACSDFLDFTGRRLTLFDREVVHTDFSDPFGPKSHAAIVEAATDEGESIHESGVYLCADGPRYETPAEIDMYKGLSADLVGMTASSEAILMREAEVDYGCLAIVTNLAAGITEAPLSHGEVVDEMNRSGETAVRILLRAAARLAGKG